MTLRMKEQREGKDAARHAIVACAVEYFDATIAPEDIVFIREGLGKPRARIIGKTIPEEIDFSVSHSSGMVVARAIPKREGRIGVDIEAVRSFAPATLEAFLTKREFRTLPRIRRNERATLLWCIKEAYLKALGVGLLIHPQRVEVQLSREGARITQDREPVATKVSWQHQGAFISTCVILPSYA